MKKGLNAALLSGLAYPGAGHLFLQRYKTGIALIAFVTVSIAALVVLATRKALGILDPLLAGGKPVTLEMIIDAAVRATTATDSGYFNLIFFVVIICWIAGILDAYRIGRKQDNG